MCRPMVHSFITLSQTLILSPCPLLQFFLKKQTNPKQTNKIAKNNPQKKQQQQKTKTKQANKETPNNNNNETTKNKTKTPNKQT